MGFATSNLNRRWPGAIMPFEIDESNFPIGSPSHSTIMEAIEHWNINTILTIVPRTDQTDYVVFRLAEGSCSSVVGRSLGGQTIGCDVGNGFGRGTVIHEIGHAAGLHHEHKRPDRDDYITVNFDNIIERRERQFTIISGLLLGEYDYGSIMHYPEKGFSINGLNTITVPDGVIIGQQEKLSGRDVWAIGIMYGLLDFTVAWEDDTDKNDYYQVLMSGFNATGRRYLGDITVNTKAKGQQFKPSIGLDILGGIICAWQDDKDENGKYQILVRGFNSDGTDRFLDQTVNPVAAGQQLMPKLAVNGRSEFVIVWQDDRDENGYYQIYARGFNADGSEKFGEILVNSDSAGQQINPDIVMASNGNFVVVWQDDKDKNNYYQIYARGFNSDGSVLFNDITVNEVAAGQQLFPKISTNSFNEFVVVWQDDRDKNGYFQIYARGFNANGTENFREKVVNQVASGQQINPDVAMAVNGKFVVVWQDDKDKNNYYQIYAKGYERDGTVAFEDRTVNVVASGQQKNPTVAIGNDSNFVVVWEDDNDENNYYEILARGFDQFGNEIFSPIVINQKAAGQQLKPSIAKRAPFNIISSPESIRINQVFT